MFSIDVTIILYFNTFTAATFDLIAKIFYDSTSEVDAAVQIPIGTITTPSSSTLTYANIANTLVVSSMTWMYVAGYYYLQFSITSPEDIDFSVATEFEY